MKRISTTTAAFLLLAGSVSAGAHMSSADTLVDDPGQEAGAQARGTEVMSARPELDEDASERGVGLGNGVGASNATFEDTTD